MSKNKVKKSPLIFSTHECDGVVDVVAELRDAFIKKGFTNEQAFQLISIILKARLS